MIFLTILVIMNQHNRNLNRNKLSITNTSIIAVLSLSILLSMAPFMQNVSAVNFGVFPPEINSVRLFSGIGSSPVIVQAESIFNSIHSVVFDIGNIDRINLDR